MIHIAKKGDEEPEARGLSRRRFLSALVGGTVAMAVPKKSYFFFGGVYRPRTELFWANEDITKLVAAVGAFCFNAIIIR